jgi:hypothetical protein
MISFFSLSRARRLPTITASITFRRIKNREEKHLNTNTSLSAHAKLARRTIPE